MSEGRDQSFVASSKAPSKSGSRDVVVKHTAQWKMLPMPLDPIRLWSSSHRKVDRIALVAHVVKWPEPDRARLGVRPVSG